MKHRNTINVVILWVVSIGLLVSMVIAFTPNLGLGGRNGNIEAPSLLEVNGDKITELDVARAMRNPPFNLSSHGETGEDLQTLLFDQLISNTLLERASAKMRVSNGEVREALAKYRADNNLAGRSNDSAYRNAIARSGFSDETFRDYLKEVERIRKFRESLTKDVSVTDAQVEQYFELNQDNYLSDPEILGRYLVVEDEELAKDLRKQLRDNPEADFAALAREYSIEKAEEGGAIAGTDDGLLAAGRAALPSDVADAAFALSDGGISDVVSSAGLYYIVKVQQFLKPEPVEFAEVADDVRETVQSIAESAALEAAIEEMREEATIEVVAPEDSQYQYADPVVASVGEKTIHRSDLAQAVYYNPSIQNFLSPQSLDMIGFFKPQILQQLIDNELAYQGAQKLETDFVGQPSQIAQSALQYVSKDIEVSDEETTQYYQDNLSEYTDPAEAEVQQLIFRGAEGGEDSAQSFQLAILNGDIALDDAETMVESYQGTFQDLGAIGVTSLPTNLQASVFGADNKGIESSLIPLTDSNFAMSPIVPLSTDKSNYTFVFADVTPESVRPLARVKSNAAEKALRAKKNEAQEAWLEELRAEIAVENLTVPEPAVDFEVDTAGGDAASQEVEPVFTTEPLPSESLPVESEAGTTETDATETGAEVENSSVEASDNSSSTNETTEETDPADSETTPADENPSAEPVEDSSSDNGHSSTTESMPASVEDTNGANSETETVGSEAVTTSITIEPATMNSATTGTDMNTNVGEAISNITSQINESAIVVEPSPETVETQTETPESDNTVPDAASDDGVSPAVTTPPASQSTNGNAGGSSFSNINAAVDNTQDSNSDGNNNE